VLEEGGEVADVLFHVTAEGLRRLDDATVMRLVGWSPDLDGWRVPLAVVTEILEPDADDDFFSELSDRASSSDKEPDLPVVEGSRLASEASQSNRGRKPANWWPEFAAQLAFYVHENGLPEHQADLESAMLQIMTDLGKDKVGRTTIQPAVAKLFQLMAGS
jgi:hypothetical protein